MVLETMDSVYFEYKYTKSSCKSTHGSLKCTIFPIPLGFDAQNFRSSHAVCTHQVHPPPPVPPFLLVQNLSPKDINILLEVTSIEVISG